jgi:hypothetical protein
MKHAAWCRYFWEYLLRRCQGTTPDDPMQAVRAVRDNAPCMIAGDGIALE